jgi:hypothetical protein
MTLHGTQTGLPAVGHAFRYGLSRGALGRQEGGSMRQRTAYWQLDTEQPAG